jgi:hypothetical protein
MLSRTREASPPERTGAERAANAWAASRRRDSADQSASAKPLAVRYSAHA